MKRIVLSVVVPLLVLFLRATADAQPDATPSIAAVLQARVPEELASEGILLSRLELSLVIEEVGDKLLVSLVDLATGKVVASTKVDEVPSDREAAIAAMTHVVADLAAQVTGKPASPAPPPLPPVASPPSMADQDARAAAELSFNRQSIRFTDVYLISHSRYGTTTTRGSDMYRGELHTMLEPEDFYRLVGRDELAESYLRRRRLRMGLGLGGVGAMTASLVLLVSAGVAYSPEDEDGDGSGTLTKISLGLLIGGALAMVVAYNIPPHPISESEAKALADDYNQNLRRKLNLPVGSNQPRRLDLKLAPYLGVHEAGLAVSGSF